MWGWLVVGLSGIIHISTANSENKSLSHIFKPVTLISLLVILIVSGHEQPQFVWFLSGLIFSLASDVVGLLARSKVKAWFILQLVAFVLYSKGFWSLLFGDIAWWLPALLFAGSVILFLLLLPKLDTVIFPVAIMGLVLVQMSWAASAVWMSNASMGNLFACIACLLFVVAMLVKATNIYRKSIKHAESWATGGFFVAQSLIVASVVL